MIGLHVEEKALNLVNENHAPCFRQKQSAGVQLDLDMDPSSVSLEIQKNEMLLFKDRANKWELQVPHSYKKSDIPAGLCMSRAKNVQVHLGRTWDSRNVPPKPGGPLFLVLSDAPKSH